MTSEISRLMLKSCTLNFVVLAASILEPLRGRGRAAGGPDRHGHSATALGTCVWTDG